MATGGHSTPDRAKPASTGPVSVRRLAPLMVRDSVTMALTSSAGVMSKAGFQAGLPGAAIRRPARLSTSSASRISIGMSAPVGVSGSMVASGAATTNGMPARRAASACDTVPTLLATSPLAAIRSAPTTTPSTRPDRISPAAAESTMTRCGDAGPAQFPGGQPAALQQRPGLAHVDQLERLGRVQFGDDAQRRAPFHPGQRAGIAVGQHGPGTGQHLGPAPAQRPVDLDVGVPDGQCPLEQTGHVGAGRPRGQQLPHAPAQVDRGRPGLQQPLSRRGQRRIQGLRRVDAGLNRGQRHPQRAGDPERHRTPDRQRPDVHHQLVDVADVDRDQLGRQPGLVDDADAVVQPVDGAHPHTLITSVAMDPAARRRHRLPLAGRHRAGARHVGQCLGPAG